MESYIKTSNTKRFVVEDSITKVTSDGEPHEMMTIIAGISGLIAAVVILAILVSLVGCKKKHRTQQCQNCPASLHSRGSVVQLPCGTEGNDSKRSSLSTVYTRSTSIADSTQTESRSRVTSVSLVQSGNLEGNLNAAFVGSELNLSGSLRKAKKKTHWSDDIEEQSATKETKIDMERY